MTRTYVRIFSLVTALAVALAGLALAGADSGARRTRARTRTASPVSPSTLQSRPAPAPRQAAPPAAQARVAATLMRMPLHFEANRGQADPRVQFLARGKGYTLFLTGTEAVLCLSGQSAGRRSVRSMGSVGSPTPPDSPYSPSTVVRMKLQGASAGRVAGLAELPGKANYFLGNDPKQWRTDVPTYGKVRYQGVYPGVDLVYYGNQGQLEYDFVLAPGADPGQIRMAFEGADGLSVDKAGDLVLHAGGGASDAPCSEMRFQRPVAYQEVAGRRVAVAAAWALDGGFRAQGSGSRPGRNTQHATRNTQARKSIIQNRKSATFRLAHYDASRPLVIDPVFSYVTCVGGRFFDEARGIAVDDRGCVYLAGSTGSDDLPGGSTNVKAMVVKLNAAGDSILNIAYLGGAGSDYGTAIAIDPAGCAYVTGYTNSNDFPTAPGTGIQGREGRTWYHDAFAAKLSAAGNALVYSTYLGGNASDQGFGIAVDGSGSAVVAGITMSTDFPTSQAVQGDQTGQDAFVTKVNADGTALVYSTYVGGAGGDNGNAVAVDAAGSAYVTGYTEVGTNFLAGHTPSFLPKQGGGADAFVLKFSPDGSLGYFTFLGGYGAHDIGYGIAVDLQGNAYVTGVTQALTFPTGYPASFGARRASWDVFVAKLNAEGTGVGYAGYISGSGWDEGKAITVDELGCAYVTGHTTSNDLPVSQGMQGYRGTGYNADAFAAKINPDGSALTWSTYLGGTTDDKGYAIAADHMGSAYVAGVTLGVLSNGWHNDFPLTTGQYHGMQDAFVAKISEAHLMFTAQPVNTSAGATLAPVSVTAMDAGGAPVNGTITLAIAPGTGAAGAALNGTLSKTTTGGVATFSDLKVTLAGSGYRLVATIATPGILPIRSTTFDITPAAPHHLGFRVGPASTAAGRPITPDVQVALYDSYGNGLPGAATISLALTGGDPAATLGGTVTRATDPATGIATFPGLIVEKASTLTYRLQASETGGLGLAPVTSGPFLVSPGPPVELAFVQQPSDAPGGTPIAPAVTVEFKDAWGNRTRSAFTVTMAIDANGGPGGILSGTPAVSARNGLATFTNLRIDKAGTGYTLRATARVSTSLTLQATSTAFGITVGEAAKLVFSTPPATTHAGGPITPVVEIRDAGANRVPLDGKTITVSLRAPAGGGTLGGTTTADTTAGQAAFTLSINTPGTGYQLQADAEGLAQAVSLPFNITAGAAGLVFQTQPLRAQRVGRPVAPAILVALVDAAGNVVTTASDRITLSLAGGDPAATIEAPGNTAVAVRGVATFANVMITKPSATSNYRLVATSGSLPQATSGEFGVSPGPAARVVFVQQPTDTAPNAWLKPAVAVAALDAYGNRTRVSGLSMAIEHDAGPGATLSNANMVDERGGLYLFPYLRIDKPGAGYTLKATVVGGTLSVTSAGFNIIAPVAGPPVRLAFKTQPATVTAGRPQGEIQVAVVDAAGIVVPSAANTITLSLTGGTAGATVEAPGNSATASRGVAIFTNVTINKAGTGYRLVAAAANLTAATSTAFNVLPASRTRLAFLQQPTDVRIKTNIAPAVQVAWQDTFGNTVSAAERIGLELVSGPAGAQLLGGASVAPYRGVARFPGLRLSKVGSYQIRAIASVDLGAGGVASFRAESQAFSVVPGPAARLAFAVPPASTKAGLPIRPVVEVRDADGNRVPVDLLSIAVTLIRPSGDGVLSGRTAVKTAGGRSAFDLSINRPATGYTLNATATGLTPAVSPAFDITPGWPAQLVFLQQPSNVARLQSISPPVRVQLRDQCGNALQTSGQAINLALDKSTAPNATLMGSTATASGGIAQFGSLRIDKAGTGYRLIATAACKTGTLSQTSTAFNVTAGAAARLAFVTPPYTTRAGSPILPMVEVQDSAGNRVPTNTVSVSVTLRAPAGGGTLSGTSRVTTATGRAAFRLSIGTPATGYQLVAGATGLVTVVSPPFDITQSPVAGLAFLSQPSDTVAGEAMPEIRVAVVDAAGQVIPTATHTVTLSVLGLLPYAPWLTATASGGIATFRSGRISRASLLAYRLEASLGSGQRPATSNPFFITPGPAVRLAFVQQPTNAVSGAAMAPAPQIAAFDRLDNRCTGRLDVSLTFENNPAGGRMAPSLPSSWQGIVTFRDLRIDKAGGGYTLRATSASPTLSVVSTAFEVVAGPAYQLWFRAQPLTVRAGVHFIPRVEVQDAAGNPVPEDGRRVLIFLSHGDAQLCGPTVAVTDEGGAIWDLYMLTAGNYRLGASSPGLYGCVSQDFTVTAGPATRMEFLSQPGSVTAGSRFPRLSVALRDEWGNVADRSPATTVTLTLSPTGQDLGQQTTSAGVAEFENLAVTRAGAFQLVGSAPGLSNVSSVVFTVLPATASRLDFNVPPQHVFPNMNIPVEVTIYDPFGNVCWGTEYWPGIDVYDEDGYAWSSWGGGGTDTGVAEFVGEMEEEGDYYLLARLQVTPTETITCRSNWFNVSED